MHCKYSVMAQLSERRRRKKRNVRARYSYLIWTKRQAIVRIERILKSPFLWHWLSWNCLNVKRSDHNCLIHLTRLCLALCHLSFPTNNFMFLALTAECCLPLAKEIYRLAIIETNITYAYTHIHIISLSSPQFFLLARPGGLGRPF